LRLFITSVGYPSFLPDSAPGKPYQPATTPMATGCLAAWFTDLLFVAITLFSAGFAPGPRGGAGVYL
jgi:hypothetical protein